MSVASLSDLIDDELYMQAVPDGRSRAQRDDA
jgi:hypothetical protein